MVICIASDFYSDCLDCPGSIVSFVFPNCLDSIDRGYRALGLFGLFVLCVLFR